MPRALAVGGDGTGQIGNSKKGIDHWGSPTTGVGRKQREALELQVMGGEGGLGLTETVLLEDRLGRRWEQVEPDDRRAPAPARTAGVRGGPACPACGLKSGVPGCAWSGVGRRCVPPVRGEGFEVVDEPGGTELGGAQHDQWTIGCVPGGLVSLRRRIEMSGCQPWAASRANGPRFEAQEAVLASVDALADPLTGAAGAALRRVALASGNRCGTRARGRRRRGWFRRG